MTIIILYCIENTFRGWSRMLNYAENIKKLRKRKHFTQSDLAKGISSQGMISKIEKKQISPDIDLLEAIAQKLECPLMELIMGEDENELSQVYSYMNMLVSKREYELLEKFFKSDSLIDKIKERNETYYKWINGVILSQNYKDYVEGIRLMTEALDSSGDDELKVRILTGLSALFSEIEEFENSIKYLLEATELSKEVQIDNNLKQKIQFKLARMYSVLEKFNDSIFYNRIGIQFAIEDNNLYLLDDFYLLLADSYLRTNKIDKANEVIKLASTIAEIKSNDQLIPYIERTQNEIEELIKNRESK